MTWTTLPTIAAGVVPVGDDFATLFTAITEIRGLGVYKLADQTNTTTTIADDTELQLSVAASTAYEGSASLIVNTSTAGDFKFQFSVPSGTTGWWNGITPSVATPTTPYTGALPIATQGQQEGSAADIFYRVTFQFLTTNAGTFKAQHALNTASGTLTVKAGSIIVARKLL